MIKDKSINKRILFVLILIEGLGFFIHTIIESRFNVHIGEFYYELSIQQIFMSMTKKHHIISFRIFTILWLNLMCSKRNKYMYILGLVFLFSAFVEVAQIFFTEGHCRLSDLFPNLVGIIFSIAIFKFSEKWLKKALFRHQFLSINIISVICLTIFAITVSYTFTELIVY